MIPADAPAGLGRRRSPVTRGSRCCSTAGATPTTRRYPGAGKKSEYPAERHPVDVADELDEGRKRLAALFGPRALPVFVPPWNRFADRFAAAAAEAGLTGCRGWPPRRGPPLPAGIAELDVHVDLVDWRGTRGFVGAGAALGRLVAELRARRRGAVDPASAVGILTHHLVMDARDRRISSAELAALVDAHRAARWVGVARAVRRA